VIPAPEEKVPALCGRGREIESEVAWLTAGILRESEWLGERWDGSHDVTQHNTTQHNTTQHNTTQDNISQHNVIAT
jgi:hypothetical protein